MLRLIDPVVSMVPHHDDSLGNPWGDLSRCATLQSAVERVAEIYEFQWHPYFIWMRAVGVERHQFVRSQVPFQYAIESFSQAFTAVFDRAEMQLPSSDAAQDYSLIATISPPRLAFQRCLSSLEPQLDLARQCPIEVAAANHSIINHCLTQPVEVGAAMLGMIEYLYVDISSTISQVIQHRDWANSDSEVHCMIHEALEINPAHDLMTLANPAWARPQMRPQIAESLMLGAQYLWELYDGLYPDPIGCY